MTPFDSKNLMETLTMTSSGVVSAIVATGGAEIRQSGWLATGGSGRFSLLVSKVFDVNLLQFKLFLR